MWPGVLHGSCLSAPTKTVNVMSYAQNKACRGANLVVTAFALERWAIWLLTWTDAQLLAATS